MDTKDEIKYVKLPYDSSISTKMLIFCVLGFRESDDCTSDDAKALMAQVVGELSILGKAWSLVRFLLVGLFVTNGMWVANYLGWL